MTDSASTVPDCNDDVGNPANAYYQAGYDALVKARSSDAEKEKLKKKFAPSGVKLSDLVTPTSPDAEAKQILDSADPDEAKAVLNAVSKALDDGRAVEYACSIEDPKRVLDKYGSTKEPMIHFHLYEGKTSTIIVAAPGPPA